MIPSDFPEANMILNPPEDTAPGAVLPIRALHCTCLSGPLDGSPAFITAWKPNPEDLERLNNGGFVYLSVIGAAPPHSLHTDLSFVKLK